VLGKSVPAFERYGCGRESRETCSGEMRFE
jgi:hypothetical protein